MGGVPMVVPLIRTSERNDFKACPWYWWHHWQNGLTTPRVPTWSWFGTAVHKALEVRYPIGLKRGPLGQVLEAFEAACDGEIRSVYEKGGELDDEEVHDGIALGRAMLTGYVKHYEQDSRWQVIHTEEPFQIDVRHPKSKRLVAIYCGTWDLFVWDRVDKCYRLVDHKTRASFKKDWTFFDMNDQGGSYLWVAKEVLVHKGLLKTTDVIDGIVFNMLRKAMPQETAEDGIKYTQPKKDDFLAALTGIVDTPPKASLTVLAKLAKAEGLMVRGKPYAVQPSPLFARYTTRRTEQNRVRQAERVLDEAVHMDLVRRGKLPLLKHVTEDCSRCSLFDFCQLDEQDTQAAQEYAATMLVKRNPYADHVEAMGIEDNG